MSETKQPQSDQPQSDPLSADVNAEVTAELDEMCSPATGASLALYRLRATLKARNVDPKILQPTEQRMDNIMEQE